MAQSFLESRVNEILDHANTTWDEHSELLEFSQELLKWKWFLAYILSHMRIFIVVLEVPLIRPFLDYLYN